MADEAAFQPWMLRSDWRTDRRQWLWVDLANRPEGVPIDPLPPVALIGTGPASYPQAPCVDLLVEEGFSLDQLAKAIERSPHAAATEAQLLRVGLRPELATFAARLTASPAAWFQLPEDGMGILPGFGGCVSVPRRVGRRRAALMMLSGKRIGGLTALQWRLVDALVNQPAPDADRTYQLGG